MFIIFTSNANIEATGFQATFQEGIVCLFVSNRVQYYLEIEL